MRSDRTNAHISGYREAVVVSTMLDRLRRPTLRPRDVLLTFTLVVRESCGVGVREAAVR